MRRAARVAALYTAFAVFASAINLGSQWVLLTVADAAGIGRELALIPALVVGTGAGLVVKYILDKLYIFDDRSRGVAAHAKRFSLYTVMGLVTTAIFWGTELLFALLDPDGNLLYLGGAIGLAIGYVVKYHLDRRYVFRRGGLAEGEA